MTALTWISLFLFDDDRDKAGKELEGSEDEHKDSSDPSKQEYGAASLACRPEERQCQDDYRH